MPKSVAFRFCQPFAKPNSFPGSLSRAFSSSPLTRSRVTLKKLTESSFRPIGKVCCRVRSLYGVVTRVTVFDLLQRKALRSSYSFLPSLTCVVGLGLSVYMGLLQRGQGKTYGVTEMAGGVNAVFLLLLAFRSSVAGGTDASGSECASKRAYARV